MLDYFDLTKEADVVRAAVAWSLDEQLVTEDLNPVNALRCSAVGDIISAYIEESGELVVNKKVTEESRGVLI
jgi:3-isopropylmalate dehydrogenase